ncbi:glycosyltransferase [Nodosilinea sp. FACHB-141]|uniref:glycosyltransferase n=1 Tax=Cyanophyceae TaxID=3028117 RepID=UPI0037C9DA8A
MAQSVAICAPLSSGSGTNYKPLEASSAGVPVVFSSLPLKGPNSTPGVHLSRSDTAQDVASALLRLMNNTALRAF